MAPSKRLTRTARQKKKKPSSSTPTTTTASPSRPRPPATTSEGVKMCGWKSCKAIFCDVPSLAEHMRGHMLETYPPWEIKRKGRRPQDRPAYVPPSAKTCHVCNAGFSSVEMFDLHYRQRHENGVEMGDGGSGLAAGHGDMEDDGQNGEGDVEEGKWEGEVKREKGWVKGEEWMKDEEDVKEEDDLKPDSWEDGDDDVKFDCEEDDMKDEDIKSDILADDDDDIKDGDDMDQGFGHQTSSSPTPVPDEDGADVKPDQDELATLLKALDDPTARAGRLERFGDAF